MNDRNELIMTVKVLAYNDNVYGENKVRHMQLETKDGKRFNGEHWNPDESIINKDIKYTIIGKIKQNEYEKDGKRIKTYVINIENLETVDMNGKEINSVILQGRITKLETKNINNRILNELVIANNYYVKKESEIEGYEQRTNWFNVNVWGEMNSEINIGKRIILEGKYEQDNWEYEGKQYSKYKITAQEIHLIKEERNEYRRKDGVER